MSETVFSEKQAAAIALLRKHPVAPLPREVLDGYSISKLADAGLIERSGIPGFWAITAAGRACDLSDVRKPTGGAPTAWIPETPSPYVANMLEHACAVLPKVLAGDELFGRTVRASALEFLCGSGLPRRLVYFAYPLGFPLKHIGWAAREFLGKRLWSEVNVSVARYEMGMPATRAGLKAEKAARAREDLARQESLRTRLRAEGSEDWEIDEYFALRADGRVVL